MLEVSIKVNEDEGVDDDSLVHNDEGGSVRVNDECEVQSDDDGSEIDMVGMMMKIL